MIGMVMGPEPAVALMLIRSAHGDRRQWNAEHEARDNDGTDVRSVWM